MTSSPFRLTDFNAYAAPDRSGSAPPTTLSAPERLPAETPEYTIEHPQNRKRLGELKIKKPNGQTIEGAQVTYKGLAQADFETEFEIHQDSFPTEVSMGRPIGSSTPPPDDGEQLSNGSILDLSGEWSYVDPPIPERGERSVSEASTEVDEEEVRRINAQLLGNAYHGESLGNQV